MSKKRRSEGPVRPIAHSTKPTVTRDVYNPTRYTSIEDYIAGTGQEMDISCKLTQKETDEYFRLHGAFAVRNTTQGRVNGMNPMASKVNRRPPGSKSGKFQGKSSPFHGVQSVKIRKSK